MRRRIITSCGAGILLVCLAAILAFSQFQESGGSIVGAADSASSDHSVTASDRVRTRVGLEVPTSRRSPAALVAPSLPPEPAIRAEVEDEIARNGGRATAEAVRQNESFDPAARTARIEEVVRQWARQDPREAGGWLEGQLEDYPDDKTFHQGALSGYVESIALIDPEAAAEAAELLDDAAGDSKSSDQASYADPGFPGDRDFMTRNRR